MVQIMFKNYRYILVLLGFSVVVFVLTLQKKSFLVEANAVEIGVAILFTLTELYEYYRWIRNKVKKVETAPKSTEMKITGILEVLLICLIIYNIIVIGR